MAANWYEKLHIFTRLYLLLLSTARFSCTANRRTVSLEMAVNNFICIAAVEVAPTKKGPEFRSLLHIYQKVIYRATITF